MLFHRITELKAAQELIARLNRNGSPVALDIETTGLDRFKDTIISAQLCFAGEAEAYYLEKECLSSLSALRAPLVLHNFKFDFGMLQQTLGIDLRQCQVHDIMLMHHLLDENAGHSLDELIQARWQDDYKEQFWCSYKTFETSPPEAQLNYACRDAVYTGKLYNALLSELAAAGIPGSLVDHVHALALALCDSELHGVRVDLDYLRTAGQELTDRITSYQTTLRLLAPLAVEQVEMNRWLAEIAKRKSPKGKAAVKKPTFNWSSGDDLKALIYGELGVTPITKYSKAKKAQMPTLDDAALEELQDAHPVIAQLRAYRTDSKIFGSFIEGTLERHRGGRIYPNFHVNGTVTGRISSSDPNLQQLPRDGGIRGIYVPDDGHMLISCDYSQLEVVVAAHYSQDPALLRIINEGASKHDITAQGLGIDRQLAKRINFALGYGAGKFKIKSILGCSEKEAEGALRRYWETYAGEKKVIDECQRKVDAGEPIVSLFGRQRHFPKEWGTGSLKQRAYRQAYNSLVQGTGADITHAAFYNVANEIKAKDWGRALFEVHDEVLIEARADEAENASKLLVRIMEESGKVLSVPLKAECGKPMERWCK